jgi:hypothetical protein
MGEMRKEYNIVATKPEEKRPLGRPRHGWGIILKWILNRMGWCGLVSSRSR